ncbi:unnamed protein product [Periconia digitata]|uniref:Transmembrane protein n=1 Tax=Periconia digitata TaxID=1303443 RepID=A0A9W4UAJ6_9PLEO|nr:unnamed protein product [Periconia digitata]
MNLREMCGGSGVAWAMMGWWLSAKAGQRSCAYGAYGGVVMVFFGLWVWNRASRANVGRQPGRDALRREAMVRARRPIEAGGGSWWAIACSIPNMSFFSAKPLGTAPPLVFCARDLFFSN